MRFSGSAVVLGAALTAFCLTPVSGVAQDPPAAGAPPASAAAPNPRLPPADSVELVFEREVFIYPTYERRNPFRPLTGDESGPRFENLVFVGGLLHVNPSYSIALVEARPPGATRAQGPTATYRLRVGDTLGNSRVLEIREDLLVAEVGEFGLFEVRTLPLRRTLAGERATEVRAAPPPDTPAVPPAVPADSLQAPQGPGQATPDPAGSGTAVPQVGAAIEGEPSGGHMRTANGGWS